MQLNLGKATGGTTAESRSHSRATTAESVAFSTSKTRRAYSPNITASDRETTPLVEFQPTQTKRVFEGHLDRALISRAREILEDLDLNDGYEVTLAIASLRCTLHQLWHTATHSSMHHQSVLAMLERAVLSAKSLTPNQASAIREGLVDLSNPRLTESHIETLRSRFIDEGYGPLAILSDLEASDDRLDSGI